MRRLLPFLIAALVSSTVLSADEGSYQDSVQKGLSFASEGKHKKAVRALARANKESGGTDFVVLSALASSYLALRNHAEAARFAREATNIGKTDEQSAVAEYLLGVALLAQNLEEFLAALGGGNANHRGPSFPEATRYLRSAFSKSKNSAAASALAEALTLQAQAGEALEILSGISTPSESLIDFLTCAGPDLEPAGDYEVEKLSAPAPIYPSSAREKRAQGTVSFQAVIDEEGAVVCLRVLQGPSEFVRSAADSVRQWRFKPVFAGGVLKRLNYFCTVTFYIG